jgi:prophage maintenance system killer protein
VRRWSAWPRTSLQYLDFDSAVAIIEGARAEAQEIGRPHRAPPVPLTYCQRTILESAILSPRAEFSGQEIYESLASKAAVLLYSLSKSQACPDGNKRIALILTYAFLDLNGATLTATAEDVERERDRGPVGMDPDCALRGGVTQ